MTFSLYNESKYPAIEQAKGNGLNGILLNDAVKRQDLDYSASSLSWATPGETTQAGMRQDVGRKGAETTAVLPTPAKNSSPAPDTQQKCGRFVVLADCASGEHHFAKRLDCNQEWCSVCGEDGSAAHLHRQSKWIPKIQQMKSMGYFVIEFPDFYRTIGQRGIDPDPEPGFWCYSKADLRDTTNKVVEVLAGKRMGRRGRVGGYFGRGLLRWHWFGEICVNEHRVTEKFVRCKLTGKQCVLKCKKPAKECRQFVNNGKWNPHMNILVDSGFIAPKRIDDEGKVHEVNLESIKAALRQALNVPDLIVNYSYTDMPGKMVHIQRYITRATFRNYDWNPYMATELWNFRNMRWWGDWKQEPAWTMDEAEDEKAEDIKTIISFSEGLCPICGEPLKVLYHNHKTGEPVRWTQPVDSIFLNIWGAEEIGDTGYFSIPHKECDGGMLSPGQFLNIDRDTGELKEFNRGDWHVAVLTTAKEYRKSRHNADNEAWWQQILSDCSRIDYGEEI
ncbi:MAG: hypothetical protein PHW65_04775 [Dehalococcoidales bacterium]|nr:hypothetical protein [Dehalococcoidales bacterium]